MQGLGDKGCSFIKESFKRKVDGRLSRVKDSKYSDS